MTLALEVLIGSIVGGIFGTATGLGVKHWLEKRGRW